MKRRALLAGVGASLFGAGCAPKRPALPPPLPPAPLHLAPITDLVAAAGLSWMVIARPAELFRTSSLGPSLSLLLPRENLDRLGLHLGFDVRLADSFVIANFGESTLYLVQIPHDGPGVEKRFLERLTGSVEKSGSGTRTVRIAGNLGAERRAMVDFEQTVIAIETGPSGPLRAAIAFSEGKLKKSKPALHADPLEALARRLGDAPLSVLAPAPGRAPWGRGAHGLLANAIAIGATATPAAEGLQVRGVALGAWDEPPTQALHRLTRTIEDVVTSPLGRLTGLSEPIVPVATGGDRDAIRFEATLDAQKVAGGLRAATTATLGEIFGKSSPPPHPG